MTQALYLENSYLKEFEAMVTEVIDDKYIVLDKTAFYPLGGGQPNDIGILKKDNKEYEVVFVKKINKKISHEINKPGLKVGDKIKGIINWEKRYKLMKAHTAAHIVSSLFHKKTGAKITGNQLSEEKIRIDYNLEDYNPEKMKQYLEEANEIIQKDLKITTKTISRTEAEKNPELFKLAKSLPESIKKLRIVSIGDFDSQADAGTHVKSTKEIGKLEFLKSENKGKNNKRLYFTIKS